MIGIGPIRGSALRAQTRLPGEACTLHLGPWGSLVIPAAMLLNTQHSKL